MVKRRIQLKDISSVAASQTAVIKLPCGPRYHGIILQHAYSSGTSTLAAGLANLSQIRCLVNGRVQRAHSAVELNDLNLLNGTAYIAVGVPNTLTRLMIHLAEPWRQDPRDMDALAWPSYGWDSFQIEIDLGAAASPTLAAYAIVDDLIPQDPKNVAIVKRLRYTIGAAGTEFDWSPPDRRDWLQQVSFYPDTGGTNALTKATLRVNGQIFHELSAVANRDLLTQNGMVPDATPSNRSKILYDMVLDHDGLLGSALGLDALRDMTFTLTAGGAMSGTIVAIMDRLGRPE